MGIMIYLIYDNYNYFRIAAWLPRIHQCTPPGMYEYLKRNEHLLSDAEKLGVVHEVYVCVRQKQTAIERFLFKVPDEW